MVDMVLLDTWPQQEIDYAKHEKSYSVSLNSVSVAQHEIGYAKVSITIVTVPA